MTRLKKCAICKKPIRAHNKTSLCYSCYNRLWALKKRFAVTNPIIINN